MDSGDVQMISGRFHCHKCKRDMNCVNENYNCPSCSTGFVEIMEVESDSQRDSDGTSGQSSGRIRRSTRATNRPYNYTDAGEDDDEEYAAEDFQLRRRNRNEYTPRTRTFRFHRRGTSLFPSRPIYAPMRYGGSTSAENRHEAGGGIDYLVDELMTNFMHGAHQQLNGYDGMNNEGPLFFVGNPGDYAWGREGLDSIVSQLLNQMDACGPPPLAKDKIKELPSLGVSQEQVDAKMQCSVCWESFQLAEMVRQLPCQHIYHETCIIPWLELHATCPICRKILNDSAGATTGEGSSGNGNEGSSRTFIDGLNANLQNGLESLLRNLDNIRHHQRY